jgi:hypothetical protein
LPKLSRLLLDTDINVDLEPLLRAIGFRPEFALRVGANVRNDADILRWARKHRYILVCHDKFKDKQTRLELYPEVYHHGGHIIQIGGGPSQDPYMSLAKILMFMQEWVNWFETNNGIVIVTGQTNKYQDARKLFTFVQGEIALEDSPVQTLKHRKLPQNPQKKHFRKQTPQEQQRF